MIREPFVLAAYLMAFRAGVFPKNRVIWVAFSVCLVLLIIGFFVNSLPIGVLAAGVWSYFWPIPFIFLIARVLEPADVRRMCTFLLIIALPMALLMVAQFRSPAGSFLNAMVGQEEYYQQFSTAEPKIRVRASGTWSYVGGPSSYWMMVAGILLAGLFRSFRAKPVLLVSGTFGLVFSTVVSHSRTQLWGVALVVAVVCAVMGVRTLQKLGWIVVGVVMVGALYGFVLTTSVGKEGVQTMSDRLETAGQHEDIFDRLKYTFVADLLDRKDLPLQGYGLGVGTNTGAMFLIGRRYFLLAENEWPRVVMEMGWFLGVGYIVVRLYLVAWSFGKSKRQAVTGNALPIGLWASVLWNAALGTWGTPPLQAFSVLGLGLCLAATKPYKEHGQPPKSL